MGWFRFLLFSLASAFCIWSICVAPVRGGTPFSLLLQRKGGKRKQLQPPVPVSEALRHRPSEPSRRRRDHFAVRPKSGAGGAKDYTPFAAHAALTPPGFLSSG